MHYIELVLRFNPVTAVVNAVTKRLLIIGQLSDCQLLRMDYVPWSYIGSINLRLVGENFVNTLCTQDLTELL